MPTNPEIIAAIGAVARSPAIRRGLAALAEVEAAGEWRWVIGDEAVPPIRPEPHVFHRRLATSPELQRQAVELGLAHPRAGAVKLPRSRAGRWDFFKRMRRVDVVAAYEATSWGWGQVMGFNAVALGYFSAVEMASKCYTAAGQAEAVRRYLQHADLIPDLCRLPDRGAAEAVAQGYNGPAWRRNDYAAKLIRAWHAVARAADAPEGRTIRDLQQALDALGHDPGKIDGEDGPDTQRAVRAFQEARGLVADGIAGQMTWAEIEDAQAEAAARRREGRKRLVATGGAVGSLAVPAGMDIMREATMAAGTARGLADQLGLFGPLAALAAAAAVGWVVWRMWPKDEDE